MKLIDAISIYKVAYKGLYTACFSLKSSKELLLVFKYLVTLYRDITFPLITKYKANSGSGIIARSLYAKCRCVHIENQAKKKTPFFSDSYRRTQRKSIISMRENCKAIPF